MIILVCGHTFRRFRSSSTSSLPVVLAAVTMSSNRRLGDTQRFLVIGSKLMLLAKVLYDPRERC
jgi:hypothetical protein